MITALEVENKCKKFAKEIWDKEFNIPIKINGRLTNALGRHIRLEKAKKSLRIEFSKKLLELHDEATIDSVIKHELTHWICFESGKPYHDGDYYFEAELRKVGAHSTGTIKYKGELFNAYCSKCSKIVVTKKTEARLIGYIQNPLIITNCCKAMVVKKFGDTIQSAKEKLKDEVIYTILGVPHKGGYILRGRKMIVRSTEGDMVLGHLLHQHNLEPQKSLVKIPQYCIRK